VVVVAHRMVAMAHRLVVVAHRVQGIIFPSKQRDLKRSSSRSCNNATSGTSTIRRLLLR
jgi:hypothetical protein